VAELLLYMHAKEKKLMIFMRKYLKMINIESCVKIEF
jgi:hypothetical protein